ncbi:hypothetical protein VIGAN_06109600 [Vigna angularis var. angularis]|uniref:Uncharacterized protein n=1 Tax=Vigna angularis var. angularis TaxID=157739 RepID=A0A0S3SAR0_PHAAN|nr:hypothetical protein VIGAN_06109600 [Vigna angularis var. angularis]
MQRKGENLVLLYNPKVETTLRRHNNKSRKQRKILKSPLEPQPEVVEPEIDFEVNLANQKWLHVTIKENYLETTLNRGGEFDEVAQLNMFYSGLRRQTRMLLDALRRGAMMMKSVKESSTIIESLATSDHQVQYDIIEIIYVKHKSI